MQKQLAEESAKAVERETLMRLLQRFDSVDVVEFVRLSCSTKRLLWRNFLLGVARGLEFTAGATVVLAVLFKVLQRVISMNIPYLTGLLQEFLKMLHGGQGM